MEFQRVFWSVVGGSEFKSGWHLEAICEHLEAVSACQIRRLMINGPPRSSKSMPASVFWPCWDWIKRPDRTWITAGNTQRLAVGFNYFSRQIIRSEKFQRYWGHIFQLALDNDMKTQFSNDRGGVRLAVGARTRFIGAGGELKVLDDPHMPNDSPQSMEDICDWYFQTWRTRTNNPMTACEVVVLQRLTTFDLGEMIKMYERDLWDILVLPSRHNSAKVYTTSLGFKDPRVVDGELLWPSHIDEESERILRRSLRERANAQMDQDPVNDDEVIYKETYLKNFYDYIEYDRETDIVATTIDTGVKANEVSDFSACGLAIKKRHRFFFLGGFAAKVEFDDLLNLYNDLLTKWTKRGLRFYKHLIEDSSNGPALASIMSKKYPRIELIKATKNKIARLKAVVPIYSSNRCFWPVQGAIIKIDGMEYPLDDLQCIDTWLDQTRKVPAGKLDCPDAYAQLLHEMENVVFIDEDLEDDEDNYERFFFLPG